MWLFYRAGWSYTHGSGFLRGGGGRGGLVRSPGEGVVRITERVKSGFEGGGA